MRHVGLLESSGLQAVLRMPKKLASSFSERQQDQKQQDQLTGQQDARSKPDLGRIFCWIISEISQRQTLKLSIRQFPIQQSEQSELAAIHRASKLAQWVKADTTQCHKLHNLSSISRTYKKMRGDNCLH